MHVDPGWMTLARLRLYLQNYMHVLFLAHEKVPYMYNTLEEKE
jgi:hypothetical protein